MKNSFSSILIDLEDHPDTSTHWSRSTSRSFSQGMSRLPYYQSQIMESSVLIEASTLLNTPLSDIENLTYISSGPLRVLQENLKISDSLAPNEKIGLSCALSSISRFKLSAKVLDGIRLNDLKVEDQIHFLLQRFAVKNRLADSANCETEFQRIKEVLLTSLLPARYILKCAAPAIVWKDKANIISDGLHSWFVHMGLSAAKELAKSSDFLDQLALSNFYRAHAMIAAARKDRVITRNEMALAKEYAECSSPSTPLEESMRFDSIKTVHESAIKEHLYVSQNLDRAQEAAETLILLDPKWPISYHEAAEVALKQGQVEKALSFFEAANRLGPPRITFSQYMIGACHEALGNFAEAIDAYTKTLELDSTNVSAAVSGHNLSKKHKIPFLDFFRRFVTEWSDQGLLDPKFLKENLI